MKLPVIATLLLSIGYSHAATLGDLCDSSNACTDANTYCHHQESDECSKGVCVCNSGYLSNSTTCLPERLHGDSCTTSSQCVTGWCSNNQCACYNSNVTSSDRRTCIYKKLGEPCTSVAQCEGSNTYYPGIRCNTICQCATGYKQVNDNTCLWHANGEACNSTYTVCGNYASCTNGTCQCDTVNNNKYEWYTFIVDGVTTGGCAHPDSIKNVGYGKTCTRNVYDSNAKFCATEYTCRQCPENYGTTNNYVCLNGTAGVRASLLAMVISLMLVIKLFF